MLASGTFLIAKKQQKKELACTGRSFDKPLHGFFIPGSKKSKAKWSEAKNISNRSIVQKLKRRSENQDPFSNERYYERF